MKKLASILLLMLFVGALAIIVAYMVQNPMPVVLQWGNTVFSTYAVVVVMLGFLAAAALFYTGQLVHWVEQLPTTLKLTQTRKQRDAFLAHIAQALLAYEEGDLKRAAKMAKTIPQARLSQAEEALAHLLLVRTGQLLGQSAESALQNPISAPIVAVDIARKAATHANWAEVRRITAIGLSHAPNQPILLTLHTKALINLNDPAVADMLPRLKPLLGPTAYKLLGILINGPTSTTARQLDHAWVKAFQSWLPTADDTFPILHTEDTLA
jgi:hypothetical protein